MIPGNQDVYWQVKEIFTCYYKCGCFTVLANLYIRNIIRLSFICKPTNVMPNDFVTCLTKIRFIILKTFLPVTILTFLYKAYSGPQCRLISPNIT